MDTTTLRTLHTKLWQWIGILIVCGLLSGCFNLPHPQNIFTLQTSKQLRIATYNVNWGMGAKPSKYPEQTIATMIKTHADVMVLQESTVYWQQKVDHSALAKLYPYRQFKQVDNAGGMAILSKYPFTTVEYLKPQLPGCWHHYWIININWHHITLQVVNVHLTPPVIEEGRIGFLGSALFKSRGIRKQEILYIYQRLNPKLPTIIAGDFNEGPKGGAVKKILIQKGLQNDQAYNSSKYYSWFWRAGLFSFYDRFDQIFYSKPLILKNLQVLYEGDSDHYPVIADFSRS